jgi:hypothetical protein
MGSALSGWGRAGLFGGVVAATATLFFLGTGLHPFPLRTWFAPLPALLLAPRVRLRISAGWPFWAISLAWLATASTCWPISRCPSRSSLGYSPGCPPSSRWSSCSSGPWSCVAGSCARPSLRQRRGFRRST